MRSEKLPDKQVNRLSVKLGYLRIEKWPIAFLYLIFLSLNNLQNVAANSVSIRPIRNDGLKGKCLYINILTRLSIAEFHARNGQTFK